MTPTERDREKARELVEGYCPPEAMGGAMINSKMLKEDIACLLADERERAAKVAGEFTYEQGSTKFIYGSDIASAIRKAGEG